VEDDPLITRADAAARETLRLLERAEARLAESEKRFVDLQKMMQALVRDARSGLRFKTSAFQSRPRRT
jgi:hypothetical protein